MTIRVWQEEIQRGRFAGWLCLAVLAGICLLLVLPGSGVASSLCKSTTTPCEAPYPKGTTITASLTGSSLLTDTSANPIVTCTGGTAKGTIESIPGAEGSILGTISELTWTGCTSATTTIKPGQITIHPIAGSDNGTLTGSGTEVLIHVFGKECTYGTGAGTDLGTFTGGAAPTIDINTIINKIAGGFLCPSTTRWIANYKVTEPTPIYVEPM